MSICISNIGGGGHYPCIHLGVERGVIKYFWAWRWGAGGGYVLRGVWGYSKYIYMREGAERGVIGGETKRP